MLKIGIISDEKKQCYNLYTQAIQKGILKRAKICEFCSNINNIEGHHNNYSKPFEVVWLCNKCHRFIHQKLYKGVSLSKMKQKILSLERNKMKKPTKRQLEVLKVLNPYLGNISYADAAKQLNTTEDNIKKIMCRLKKRCPEVYENFNLLKKNLNNGQNKVDNAGIIEPNKIDKLNIREKF